MSTAVTVLWLILQIPAASLEWMDTAVSVMAMAPTLTLNVKYQVSYLSTISLYYISALHLCTISLYYISVLYLCTISLYYISTLTLNVKYQVSYELPADEVSFVISKDLL